jgi:hypothetical protein
LNASKHNTIQATPEVLAFVKTHGLGLAQLEDMLRHAALCSHEKGNRRYHDWVFQLRQGVIFRMTDVRTGASSDTIRSSNLHLAPGEFLVYEDCTECRGKGCRHCDGGQVPRVRRLQANRIGAMQ